MASFLTQEERDRVETVLLKARDRMAKRLERRDAALADMGPGSDGDLSEFSYHLADQGTDAMEREKAYLMASEEGRMLYELNDALRRFYKEPESFGRCAECGDPIGMPRLEAIPHTTLCVDCKNSEEAGR